MNRRQALKCAAGGVLATWATSPAAQQPVGVSVIDAGGANVAALRLADGFVLVDSGPPKSEDKVLAALGPNARVHTLFNTHYHLDQTGNNELFAGGGAKIVAHRHTQQWMSSDYWVPGENRYERARPGAARPTETFLSGGTLKLDAEQIEYGHLPLAHTDGDIFVFFRRANVLAAGDVASPLRDPALDWYTGAWIGGRVDAMDAILELSNEETRIVPAYGTVMSRAEFKVERDMMEEVRRRVWEHTLKGYSPQEMLEAGVLKGLPRAWQDPFKFLNDAAKGMFAHHNKLDPSVI